MPSRAQPTNLSAGGVHARSLSGPAVGVIALIAIVTRGACLWSTLESPLSGLLLADQRLYWDWAATIARGDWSGHGVFTQGPLYPYLVAIVTRLTGPVQSPVLCLQILAGTASCCLVFDCGRRILDGRTAWLAGLMACGYGPFIFYECMIHKTWLSPFLTAVVLWSGIRYAESRSSRWTCLAGIAVGLACLVRENHALLLIPMLFWIGSRAGAESPLNPRRRVRHGIVMLLATFAVILPVTIRNALVADEFVVVTSGGGEVFYLGHGPTATGYYSAPPFIRSDPRFEHDDFRAEGARRSGRAITRGESSSYWLREAIHQVAADPTSTATLSIRKLCILLNNYEVPDSEDYQVARQVVPSLGWFPGFGFLVPTGLLGIVIAMRRGGAHWLLLGLLFSHAVSVLLLFNFGRFRLGMVPLWLLLSALGAVWLVRQFVGADRSNWPRSIAALVLTAAAAAWTFLPPAGFSDTEYAADSEAMLQTLQQREMQLLEIAALKQAAVGETGQTSTTRTALAHALATDGSWDAAEVVLRSVLIDAPGNREARRTLALLLLERGQFERGTTLLLQTFDPETPAYAADNDVGVQLERIGFYEQAVLWYRKSLQQRPTFADAHYNLGVSLWRLGLEAEAITHYENCLQSAPDHADAHNNLGGVLLQRGAVQAAVEHLQQAVASDPSHAAARANLQAAYEAMRQAEHEVHDQ